MLIALKRAWPIKIRLLLLIGCCLNGNKFSSCVDERRARVQPCHISLALMRASASEVRLSNRLRRRQPRREMTLPRMCRKGVPQRLKAVVRRPFAARLNPCPSCRYAFPSACLALAPRTSTSCRMRRSKGSSQFSYPARIYLPRKNFGPKKAQGLKPGFLWGLCGPVG